MKRFLCIFGSMLCVLMVLNVVYANAESVIAKGDKLFTRTNLLVKGKTVFFHNMSALADTIHVGTEVEITGTAGKLIYFKVIDTGKSYHVTDKPSVYAKYFVKDKDEIGLELMDEKAKEAVKGMTAYSGMTKNEVFASKGCPAYIGYGVKSWGHSLDQLMASDTWYYNLNTRKKDMVIEFEDGIAVKVLDRIGFKKVKEK